MTTRNQHFLPSIDEDSMMMHQFDVPSPQQTIHASSRGHIARMKAKYYEPAILSERTNQIIARPPRTSYPGMVTGKHHQLPSIQEEDLVEESSVTATAEELLSSIEEGLTGESSSIEDSLTSRIDDSPIFEEATVSVSGDLLPSSTTESSSVDESSVTRTKTIHDDRLVALNKHRLRIKRMERRMQQRRTKQQLRLRELALEEDIITQDEVETLQDRHREIVQDMRQETLQLHNRVSKQQQWAQERQSSSEDQYDDGLDEISGMLYHQDFWEDSGISF